MLNGSHIIKGRWKIIKKIGQGAFGEIHQAKNIITSEMVAIKIERVDSKKQVLKLEVAVLKKLQECQHVCRFITCGRFAEYNYLVMELLGENLSELRRKQADGKFSLPTTIKLGKQMLTAIEASHELGYLHRDIKPSNFAMGGTGSKRQTVFMIDFGLARRFLLNNGDVRPARDSTGFRGTARYASINSHLCKDLGRRDDLWSLFYVLVEFAKGSLPWRKFKDKDQIGEMKIQQNTPELVADLPVEFLQFMQYLQALGYEEKPDYIHLQTLLSNLYNKLGADDNTLFDWEIPPTKAESIVNNQAIQRFPSSLTNSQYSKKDTESAKGSHGKEVAENKDSSDSLRYQSTSPSVPQKSAVGFSEFTATSPLMSGAPTKSTVYISSSGDTNKGDENQKTRHRRSSSLPSNLVQPSGDNPDGIHQDGNQSRSNKPPSGTSTPPRNSRPKSDSKDGKTLELMEKRDSLDGKHRSKMDFSFNEKNEQQCCKSCILI